LTFYLRETGHGSYGHLLKASPSSDCTSLAD
jgi:hypothetical protein